MRYLAVVPVTVLLAGCAGQYGFRPTMEADAPITGGEGIVLSHNLSKAYVEDKTMLSCQSTRPGFQEKGNYQYRSYARPDGRTARFECIRFRTAADFANEGENSRDLYKAAVLDHLEAGFALSDFYCDTFFRRIALRSSSRKFARSGANDVGAAVSATLGLTAAGSAVTGGVGAGFGLIDSFFRNYDEAFLVASDLPNLENAVIRAQTEYREKLDHAKITSFPSATTAILRYAYFCSFTGMRGLINEKLEGRKDLTLKGLEDALATYEQIQVKLGRNQADGAAAPAIRDGATPNAAALPPAPPPAPQQQPEASREEEQPYVVPPP